jgi:predicted DNA-binding antitoxin AbrB/MazE fold protein
MTTSLKAIYEHGVLRLKGALALPDGAEVEVTVTTHDQDNGERAKGMDDGSWDTLTQLLAESEIDTGVPDLAHQHDHDLYGIPKN